jgi:hypothetical protein
MDIHFYISEARENLVKASHSANEPEVGTAIEHLIEQIDNLDLSSEDCRFETGDYYEDDDDEEFDYCLAVPT